MRRVSGAEDSLFDLDIQPSRRDAVYHASRGVDRTPVSSFVSQESSRHVRDVINRKTFFTAHLRPSRTRGRDARPLAFGGVPTRIEPEP